MRQGRQLSKIVHVDRFGNKKTSEFQPITKLINSVLCYERQYPFLKYFEYAHKITSEYSAMCSRVETVNSTLLKYNSSGVVTVAQQPNDPSQKNKPKNITRYLRPLEDYYNWVPTVTNIWNEIMRKSGKIPLIDEKSNNDWIYKNYAEDCPYPFMIPHMEQFARNHPNYNFHFVLKFNELNDYKISDFSFTNKHLLETRESKIASLNRIINTFSEIEAQLGMDIHYQQQVESDGFDRFVNSIKPYDFNAVFRDNLSIKSLDSMLAALHNTPGGMEWLKKDGHIFSKDPIWRLIQKDKRVDDCGHTGGTMSWTMTTVRNIHEMGWNNWVAMILLNRGIGVPQVGFDRCLEKGHSEHGCLYLLNVNQHWPSEKYFVSDVHEIAKSKGFSNLIKKIDTKYGNQVAFEKEFC